MDSSRPPKARAMDDNLVEILGRCLKAQRMTRRDFTADMDCVMSCRTISVDDYDCVQHYEQQKVARLNDRWEQQLPTHNMTPCEKVILLANKLRFSFNPYHTLCTSRQYGNTGTELRDSYHLRYFRDPHKNNPNWECAFNRWAEIFPLGPKSKTTCPNILKSNKLSRDFQLRKPV